MNPTEALRVSERIAVLETQQRKLQSVTKADKECARLRDLLEQAEIDARERVRPELHELGKELVVLRPKLRAWEQAAADTAKAEGTPLDAVRRVTMRLVDRIERSRTEGGIDWSNQRIVLARYGLLELWWCRSGKHWADQLQGYVSHGGCLKVATMVESQGRGCKYHEISDDGRLSRDRLLSFAGAINAHFGIPDVAESLNWKKTLLIEDEPNSHENTQAQS